MPKASDMSLDGVSPAEDEYNPTMTLLEKDFEYQHTRKPALQTLFHNYSRFALAQLLLIAFYTFVFFKLGERTWGHYHGPNLIYSPAREALEYEKVHFNATLVIDSPYIGAPGPAVDGAWHELMENMDIIVDEKDLNRINKTSIPIPGQEGKYSSALSVYHELHCLKRLRQHTWLDYYWPNLTTEEQGRQRLHTDHCIEVLRQGIMCRADISLLTFYWTEEELVPKADFSAAHECVNFAALAEWSSKRRFNGFEKGLLVHPIHGAAFPDGRAHHMPGLHLRFGYPSRTYLHLLCYHFDIISFVGGH